MMSSVGMRLQAEGPGNETEVVDWAGLVAGIQNSEQTSTEQLYLVFAQGIRHHLSRYLAPQDIESKFRETFSLLVQAIQRGDVREPERLPAFVRTLLRGALPQDRPRNLEQSLPIQQKAAQMKLVLDRLPGREREALIRFYLQENTSEEICREMNLTAAQFCSFKSRALAQFEKIGNNKPQQSVDGAFSMRTSA